LKVEGDSQLIIRQITGQYQVKNERLKVFHKEAIDLVKHFEKLDIRQVQLASYSHG
jgi:ribonuclease HI